MRVRIALADMRYSKDSLLGATLLDKVRNAAVVAAPGETELSAAIA